MLQDLGYDLLIGHVFPNLSARDIVSVSMCSKQLNATVTQIVWRSQYQATFDRNSKVDHLGGDWEKNYSRRMNSSIYFWGKSIFDSSILPRNLPRNNHFGICAPWKFPGQSRTRQISFGGYGLWMLDFDGNIWLIGSQGPNSQFHGRAPLCLSETVPDPIDYISAGRSHLVALSGGRVLIFCTRCSPSGRAMLDIPDSITSISAGWEATAAISVSRGVIIWKDIVEKPNEINIVEGTKGKRGSVAVGAGFTLFLDEASNLHFIETGEDYKLSSKRILTDEYPVFIRSNYIRFAVICASKRAYIGSYRDGEIRLELIPDSDVIDFCDIALGDHHNLGLSKGGSVYSWGCESKKCGSLGLGTKRRVLSTGGTEVSTGYTSDLELLRPTKLALGSVLSIDAGGWQSAAITADPETMH